MSGNDRGEAPGLPSRRPEGCPPPQEMLPVVAILGRPNVGKSTLFNCLTRSRRAVVADTPGVTRDRQYGVAEHPAHPFIVVDTGGLEAGMQGVGALASHQSRRALTEADVVILLLDARTGLVPGDHRIAEQVRRKSKPVVVVANKTDGLDEAALLDFHDLGLGDPIGIAAAHRRGLRRLRDALSIHFVPSVTPAPVASAGGAIRIAVLGRPNAGKSTFINRVAGDQRVVTHDLPGTTRDSVQVPVRVGARHYTLIDTAGIRRRRRISEAVEKFSVIKALEAMQASDAVVFLLDASDPVSDQDLRLLGHVVEAGRALAIGVNKWDRLGEPERRALRGDLQQRLAFVDYAHRHFISALHGRGVGALLRSAEAAYRSARARFPTTELTRTLQDAVARHPPPIVRGRRIKLRYAHQGGSAPPRFIVHGNQTDALPEAYRRFLAAAFRRHFQLRGTPLRVEFRSGDNPYQGRRNTLTPRQQRRRKRLLRHARK